MAGPKDKRKYKDKLKEKYIKKYAKLEPRYGKDKFLFGDAYIESKLGKRFESELKRGGLERIKMHNLYGVAKKRSGGSVKLAKKRKKT
jgi:hypothetical protein